METLTSSRTYTPEAMLEHKYDYNPRDVPNEIRNFKTYLVKCPQLAEQMQLTVEMDGVVLINSEEVDENIVMIRKLKSVLNRLTENNYATLLSELRDVGCVTDDDVLAEIVKVVMNNIKSSQDFVRLYARLAKDIKVCDTKGASLGQLLNDSAAAEFLEFQKPETRARLKEQLTHIADTDDRFEAEARARKGCQAVACFIAQLYVQGVAPKSMLTTMLDSLLQPIPPVLGPDPYNLDFLMAVYPVARHRLIQVSPQGAARFEDQLRILSRDPVLGFRLRFLLEDFLKNLR